MADNIPVGTRVSFRGSNGVVRFFGPAAFGDGIWVGIEVDEEGVGKHDGSIRGERYFTCEKPGKYGLFARPSMVTVLEQGSAPAAAASPSPSPTKDAGSTGELRTVAGTSKAVEKYILKAIPGPETTEISFKPFAKKAPMTSFPPKLFEHANLVSIDFVSNYLTDLPDISAMRCLVKLRLSKNKFTTFPREVCRVTSLRELLLDNNSLTNVDADVGTMPNLEILDVAYNSIAALPSSLATARSIVRVDITGNAGCAVPGGLDGKVVGAAAAPAGDPKADLLRAKREEKALLEKQQAELQQQQELLLHEDDASERPITKPKPAPKPGGTYTTAQMSSMVEDFINELRWMQQELDPVLEKITTLAEAAEGEKTVDDFLADVKAGEGFDDFAADNNAQINLDDDHATWAPPVKHDREEAEDMEEKEKHKAAKQHDSDDEEEGEGDKVVTEEEKKKREIMRRRMVKREKKAERRARARVHAQRQEYRRAERQRILEGTFGAGNPFKPTPEPDYNSLWVEKDEEETERRPALWTEEDEKVGPDAADKDLDTTGMKDLAEVDPEQIRLTGEGMQGARLKAKSSHHRRLERYYNFEWQRRPAGSDAPWRTIAFANKCMYVPGFLDVGMEVRLLGHPKVAGQADIEPLSFVREIQPGLPEYRDISIEGQEYHNTRFTINGCYWGGIEGKSIIKWYKTYDGDTYTELRGVEADGRAFQATSDDVSAQLRVEYTPVRADGTQGPTVFAETEQIVIAPKVVRIVRQFLHDTRAEFKVEAQGKKCEVCTLKIKNDKLSLKAVRSSLTIYKVKFSKDVKVFLHPVHKTMLKLQLSEKDAVILKCDDSGHRDVIALTLSFFARSHRDK